MPGSVLGTSDQGVGVDGSLCSLEVSMIMEKRTHKQFMILCNMCWVRRQGLSGRSDIPGTLMWTWGGGPGDAPGGRTSSEQSVVGTVGWGQAAKMAERCVKGPSSRNSKLPVWQGVGTGWKGTLWQAWQFGGAGGN